ncbi:hypothetical protein CEXT_587631 [Caerostris extrusa]|uniref:Uncharacterized protein n=1 Tax=Caerostris extrusa TaxID=172846 RepID=A0AAV4R4F4_CAEEX|nr:hypothetical protein CEXT_587631 [Caerostris extrusa]
MERRLDNFTPSPRQWNPRNDHGWINARRAEILLEPLTVTLCGRCNIIDKREPGTQVITTDCGSFMNPILLVLCLSFPPVSQCEGSFANEGSVKAEKRFSVQR